MIETTTVEDITEAPDIHALVARGNTAAVQGLLCDDSEAFHDINEQGLSVFEALLSAGYTAIAKILFLYSKESCFLYIFTENKL